MVFTPTSPVVVGAPTKADDYDKAFDNTIFNKAAFIAHDHNGDEGETQVVTAGIADDAVTNDKVENDIKQYLFYTGEVQPYNSNSLAPVDYTLDSSTFWASKVISVNSNLLIYGTDTDALSNADTWLTRIGDVLSPATLQPPSDEDDSWHKNEMFSNVYTLNLIADIASIPYLFNQAFEYPSSGDIDTYTAQLYVNASGHLVLRIDRDSSGPNPKYGTDAFLKYQISVVVLGSGIVINP